MMWWALTALALNLGVAALGWVLFWQQAKVNAVLLRGALSDRERDVQTFVEYRRRLSCLEATLAAQHLSVARDAVRVAATLKALQDVTDTVRDATVRFKMDLDALNFRLRSMEEAPDIVRKHAGRPH